MSTGVRFNTKSPTIKRILKEASELATNASADFHAAPLEDNLFEWHFTLRGPPSPSPYAGGLYHGRIVLPPTYPLRPPSFRFLTPSGRFEANREICLSISGHHEETWQPAWGIRTAMVAIRGFMDTDAKGQVGGLECSPQARQRMAAESGRWRCGTCGKSNEEIMSEREEEVRAGGEEGKREEVVPEELRLAYREDLQQEQKSEAAEESIHKVRQDAIVPVTPESKGEEKARLATISALQPIQGQATTSNSQSSASQSSRNPNISTAREPTRAIQLRPPRQVPLQTGGAVPTWIDKAIYGVLAALIFMVLRKIF